MKITVHCSDSDILAHDDIRVIDEWHRLRNPPFRKGGYHIFIKSNGDPQDYITNPREARRLYPFEQGAHVRGYNENNIGICIHGRNHFTDASFRTLRRIIANLQYEFDILNEEVQGHNYYDKNKTCPNFNVHEILWGHKNVKQWA